MRLATPFARTLAALTSLAGLAAVAGCDRASYILVHVEGPPSLRMDALDVTMTNAGQRGQARFARAAPFSPPQSFFLSFDQERSGDVTVEVTATLAGAPIAHGTATAPFKLHETSEATVTLGASTQPDMTTPPDMTAPPDLTPPPDQAANPTWVSVNIGSTAKLNGVWAMGSTVLIVGDASGAASRGFAALSQDAGRTWNTAGISTPPLFAAWGTAADHLYAVGDDGIALENASGPWAKFLFGKGTSLTGMSGPSDDLFVIGYSPGGGGVVLASQNDFKVSVTPSAPSPLPLVAISAEKGNVYVADSDGNIFHGPGWTRVPGSALRGTNGLWLRNGDLFAVGNSGAINFRQGSLPFAPMVSGSSANLYSIWCGMKDCFAVGAQGTVLHLSNNGWSIEVASTKSDLLGVFGTGDAVYAVGSEGVVVRRAL